MNRATSKTLAGVTLIELLVTLSVLVILMTLGIPQLGYMVAHNTRSAEVNTLIGQINFARSLAISSGSVICVCPVNVATPTACKDTAWSDGYAVLVEDGGAPLRLRKGAGTINITDNNDSHEYCFRDDGSVEVPGTFTFCDARDDASADDARADGVSDPIQVVVSRVGRVALSEESNIDCSD